MGRPLPRKKFGPTDGTTPASGDTWSADGENQVGNTTNTGYNIPVYKARVTGGQMDSMDNGNGPYILKQKSARRFQVRTDDGDGVCLLVNDDGSSGIAEGEMVIQGFTSGDNGAVYIRKISGRKAYDFSGNAYKWEVQNDSTANLLVLTAI